MRIDLDALFATAPSPFVLIDRDLRMVWANDAYLRATGRSREGLIGRIMTEEFPAAPGSESDRMLRASFRKVMKSGTIDHLPLIPYPISSPEGQAGMRYWSATHTPIKDAAGAVEFILQNTNDVTDLYIGGHPSIGAAPGQEISLLQRAQAIARENLALGSATALFQAVFDQSPSFIAVLTGADHVFQLVNPAYTALVGERELLGKPVREALPEIEGQGFFELLDQVLASGRPVTELGAPLLVRRNPQEPPKVSYVDFLYQPLKDSSGSTTGIFVQGHDVTAQKVAEAELVETRERFRSMAQVMPNHVWTATPDGQLDWLNDQTYSYTGVAEGELFGTDWAKVVHPADRPATEATWLDAIRQGVAYETEFRIRRADGAYRWHLVRAAPIRSADGHLTRWVGTNTDIEDRKTSEAAIAQLNATLEQRVAERNRELEALHATLRQSQKMEAIGNLAGGIAHDFNNLLQTITGSLQLASRGLPVGSPTQARIDQAMRAVGRAATLSSQLLSFGRRQPLEPKVINLGRLLREVDTIVRSAVGEQVQVETVVAGGLWNTCVDPGYVENAILNLALNARDAMEGHGRLTVEIGNASLDDAYCRAHADVKPGQYVMLAVSDTGAGIAPEVIDKVFDPFFTTKPDGAGTGLGMSMVYGFVKQSGGHIKVYSELGSGTVIKIYLPRSLEDEDALRPSPTGAITGGTETVLLVEDDEDVRATAVGLLSDLGYSVLQASDADRAMAIIESGARIDLLFTDVVMPGHITSRQMAEKAKLLMPDLKVLFTSGYTRNSVVHGGRLDAGVNLLSKPYTLEAMAAKIRDVLGPEAPATEPQPGSGHDAIGASPLEQVAESGEPGLRGLRVLACEDDAIIRLSLVFSLRDAGCTVLEAGTARRALDLLAAEAVDVLVADVSLPDQSGVDLAAQARGICPGIGVVFATGQMRLSAAAQVPRSVVLSKPYADADLFSAIRSALPTRCDT